MPRAAKLKVYRTPIGFHDAYVAAPSQKAALVAWGSDANLFARGVAEQVTDPALMKEALAHPGEVIRKLRGTAEEQLAALPPDTSSPKRKPPAKPKPRPSRAALDKAEQGLAELEDRQRAELVELERREAELRRERQALEKRQSAQRAKAEKQIERQRAAYAEAMEKWRSA